MANNQYVNKVVFGDQTLIDLTNDTVAADKILGGYTAHGANGATITGTIQTLAPSFMFDANGHVRINFARGLYDGYMSLNSIQIPIPSSGTNSITIKVPNGVAEPDPTDDNDWIPITIEVDSNGNSNITSS